MTLGELRALYFRIRKDEETAAQKLGEFETLGGSTFAPLPDTALVPPEAEAAFERLRKAVEEKGRAASDVQAQAYLWAAEVFRLQGANLAKGIPPLRGLPEAEEEGEDE